MGDPQPLREVMAADRLLLTAEEAANVLRVGRTTVYALMKSGELRPVHIGRSCRISKQRSSATCAGSKLSRLVHSLRRAA